jgi:PIN domain nuclease of toxin-antitoxin system
LRILLDTHLLLWWLDASASLSAQARETIRDPENTVFEPFESLPLTAAHTRPVSLLPWRHRDPFDRMLVAQAQVENLVLLTADGLLTGYGPFVHVV